MRTSQTRADNPVLPGRLLPRGPSKNLASSTFTETKLIIQTIRFLTNTRGLITSTEKRRDWRCSSVGRELA